MQNKIELPKLTTEWYTPRRTKDNPFPDPRCRASLRIGTEVTVDEHELRSRREWITRFAEERATLQTWRKLYPYKIVRELYEIHTDILRLRLSPFLTEDLTSRLSSLITLLKDPAK